MLKKFMLFAAIGVAIAFAAPAHAQYATGKGYGGGYGYGYNNYPATTNRTVNQNITGAFPGSGPYDSGIAQSGIMAGAAIIGQVINKFGPQAPPPAPPQQIIIQQAPPANRVYVPSATREAVRDIDCRTNQIGYDMAGRPIFGRDCR